MYLCKSLTNASLPEIGRSFGGKHHSTVIHSIRKIEDLRQRDADFNTLDQQADGVFSLSIERFSDVFHSPLALMPEDALWTRLEGIRPRPGTASENPPIVTSGSPQPKR